MKKSINGILSIVLVLVSGATVFTACESKHEHGFSEEWTPDETGHWHACTGEDCNEKEGFAAHVYDTTPMQPATCAVMKERWYRPSKPIRLFSLRTAEAPLHKSKPKRAMR